MQVSIVMATHNKPLLLRRTLDSIFSQEFNGEVIVVDDGDDAETKSVCDNYLLQYHKVKREPGYRNPSFARNIGYKHARGDIVIAQSDDVVHWSERTIECLCQLQTNQFFIAAVNDVRFGDDGQPFGRQRTFTSEIHGRALFFLGSVWRADLYAIGGNDEDFVEPGFDDDWFSDCLMGSGKECVFRDDIIGLHQHHARPSIAMLKRYYSRMKVIYDKKVSAAQETGVYCASGGPWKYTQGKGYFEND